MAAYAVGALPDEPLAAAAAFHGAILPRIIAQLGSAAPVHLTLIFAPADHPHRDWRSAAVATLAREMAPVRINAVVSADPAAITAALAWLDAAPGITGQYLPLDSAGAGDVIGSPE